MNTRQNASKKTLVEADLSAESLTFDSLSTTRVWQWLDKKFTKLNESINERLDNMNSVLLGHECDLTNKITHHFENLIKESEKRLLSEFDKRFGEIREEVNGIIKRVALLETVAVEIEVMKTQINELKNHSPSETEINEKFKTELNMLKTQIKRQENKSVSCDLRISGIPFFESENLQELFSNICHAINFNTPSYKAIYRIHNNNNNKNARNRQVGTIAVKLLTPFDKNAILRAYALFKKTQKCQLSLFHIGYESSMPVYINENLTVNNFKILQAALNLKRKKIISTAYSLRGLVYIKRVSTGQPEVIDDIADLNHFFREACDAGNNTSYTN